MLRTRVIPCLLLKGQGLVKTVQFKNPTYVGDPLNAVKIFNEKEVDELVFLDITATREGRKPNRKMLADIASECFMPLGYGGGIRDLDEIRAVFGLGVEKVIVNSVAVEDPAFVRRAADAFGSQSIMVSIDAAKTRLGKYRVHTRSGTRASGLDPESHAVHMEKMGAGEIIITSMDRDGTQKGYDLELIRTVAHAVSIPVIACGGAAGMEDFRKAVVEGGASAVAAGSLFVFHGPRRAVLINFPSPEERKTVLGSRVEQGGA